MLASYADLGRVIHRTLKQEGSTIEDEVVNVLQAALDDYERAKWLHDSAGLYG